MQTQMGHGRNNYVATNRQLVLVGGALAVLQPLVKGVFLFPTHPGFLGPGFQLLSVHQLVVLMQVDNDRTIKQDMEFKWTGVHVCP